MWGNKWGASGYQVQSCHFKIVLQNILPPAASNLSSEGDSEHMTKKYTYDSYEFIWHIFKEDLSINLSIHPPIHDLCIFDCSLLSVHYIYPNIHNLVGWSCGANILHEKNNKLIKDQSQILSKSDRTDQMLTIDTMDRLDSCMQKRTWLD